MIKLSKLINEKEEALSNPVVQKIDFNKPTVIHISDEEMKLLHQDKRLEKDGLVFSGVNPDLKVVEAIEIPGNSWYVATQYHPELKSRINKAHPLFREFIKAAKTLKLNYVNQ